MIKNKCNECSNNNFCLSYNDLYKEVWEGRNFEISHLWQRSVFLATFMLAIMAGYGALLLELLKVKPSCTPTKYHLVAVLLCYLGYIFSLLWVMMAKGSKFWYERYERAISVLVKDSIEKNQDIPYYGNLPKPYEMNDSVLNTSAGHYSVSKINICIGIIGIFAWSIINVVHSNYLFSEIFKNCEKVVLLLLGIGQCGIISFILVQIIKKICISGEKHE